MKEKSISLNPKEASYIITLDSKVSVETRIDYIKLLIDNSHKRFMIVDSARNSNLNYALITFVAAFGASLNFLKNENPYVISSSLLILALAFFLRDFLLHKYSHGWSLTMRYHLNVLSNLINDPSKTIVVKIYCKEGESNANRKEEWFAFSRLVYYILILAALLSFFLLKKY